MKEKKRKESTARNAYICERIGESEKTKKMELPLCRREQWR